jgi:prepilin-type N-terminal cleavage/methylation domain-containing protein
MNGPGMARGAEGVSVWGRMCRSLQARSAVAARLRRRLRPDTEGFTLLEVMVALSVLAIVVLPVAGVFYGGATRAGYNRDYGDAVAIADGFLANANGITYANLGFFESQCGAQTWSCSPSPPTPAIPQYNGQDSVDLGATPPAGVTPQVAATSTPQQVGNIVFNERTYVVWANASGGSSDAYKQVYAVVTFPEGGNTVTVTQSILVYPGGLGQYTGPENNTPSGTVNTPDNTAGLAVTVPPDPAGETQVNLTWTAPTKIPGFYIAEWAPDPGGQADLPTPSSSGTATGWAPTGSTTSTAILGTATSFTVTGLAPSTTYWFEIIAFSSDGAQWAASQDWVSGTTLNPPPQPCTLNTLTVSQANQPAAQATVTKSSGHLTAPLSIVVTYSGTCAATDTVTVDAQLSGVEDPSSPYTLAWGSTQYSASVCPAAGFADGTHTYVASLDGTPVNLTAQVSFTLDKKAKAAC